MDEFLASFLFLKPLHLLSFEELSRKVNVIVKMALVQLLCRHLVQFSYVGHLSNTVWLTLRLL